MPGSYVRGVHGVLHLHGAQPQGGRRGLPRATAGTRGGRVLDGPGTRVPARLPSVRHAAVTVPVPGSQTGIDTGPGATAIATAITTPTEEQLP